MTTQSPQSESPAAPSSARRLWETIPEILNTGLLTPESTVIIVLVDGLGAVQLEEFRGHTPFLRSARNNPEQPGGGVWETVYPTTTAAALTSFGTGLPPGQHGVVGYDVYDPDRDVVINQLGDWDEATVPETWQPHPTLFAQLPEPYRAVTVSLPAFKTSALTRAGLSGTDFLGAKKLTDRFQRATRQALSEPGQLIYLYANELDQAGHRYGPGSERWIAVLEEIDAALARMIGKLHRSAGDAHPVRVVLTADHGMVEIPEEHRIDFSKQDPALLENIAHTAGEPRFVQLHFAPGTDEEQKQRTEQAWRDTYGEQAWIMTRQQAIAADWFGLAAQVDQQRVAPRIGDLLVASRDDIALYDGRRTSAESFKMVGHHGSLTDAERLIPWLILN